MHTLPPGNLDLPSGLRVSPCCVRVYSSGFSNPSPQRGDAVTSGPARRQGGVANGK